MGPKGLEPNYYSIIVSVLTYRGPAYSRIKIHLAMLSAIHDLSYSVNLITSLDWQRF